MVRVHLETGDGTTAVYLDGMFLTLFFSGEPANDIVPGQTAVFAEAPSLERAIVRAALTAGEHLALLIVREDAERALYLLRERDGTIESLLLAEGETLAPNTPLGIKAGRVFWVAGNGFAAAYDIGTGTYFARPLSPVDDRDEVAATFDQFPYTLILRGGAFSFSHPEFGELGSDDDGIRPEVLRRALIPDGTTRDDLVDALFVEPIAEPRP